mgnify:FL=1
MSGTVQDRHALGKAVSSKQALAAALRVAQYVPGQRQGHYESYFFRANHPERPLAFWIRYTLFSPHRQPERAIGELWGIWFDGESNTHVAVKKELPMEQCLFGREEFHVRIGAAGANERELWGEAQTGDERLRWRLAYAGKEAPLLFLPPRLYEARLPRAKSLVLLPLAHFDGELEVNGTVHRIQDWVGSQNHNWGLRHTDSYAWGQVAGFDNAPESFLEVATARIKLGWWWTPPLTPLVLRHRGREYALTEFRQTRRARGRWDFFSWQFATENDEVRIRGEIEAPATRFVALRYYNPPGGEKHCLNSKLARCRLQVEFQRSGQVEELVSEHRAAFEILTDRRDHGLPVRV